MKGDKVQNSWDNAAQAWSDFVRTEKDYNKIGMTNPAMFEILGNIRGKKILDLGCGEGYNSRLMARKGAEVIGVDFSDKMINLAIKLEQKNKQGITYYVLDAANLYLFNNNTFDIVACFMALQDIEKYQDAIKEMYRILKRHGRFVFVIPHPCFERRIIGRKTIGGWEYKKGTKNKSIKDALYYKVDRYFDTHRYIIPWNMKRLTKHFTTMTFHRTLTDYADALHSAGLVISRLKEPKPTRKGLAKYSVFFTDSSRIPQAIIIEAVKC